MSFRLPDVLRRHHSTNMRYSQVKAVTFEKNIKSTALTATFYSLVVLLAEKKLGSWGSISFLKNPVDNICAFM